MPTPVFSRAREVIRQYSGSARGGLRSGVGVGFDSASTMLDQPLNGDARRMSGSSCKVRPLRNPHSNDRRHSFDRIPLPFASALSDYLRVFSATRPAGRVVSPSRSGGQRSRTARTRGVSDQKARLSREEAAFGFCRTPHTVDREHRRVPHVARVAWGARCSCLQVEH